ncbi:MULTISPECIES: alpha-glucan family phosphorylase [Halomonadaceae]|uniref:Alpha-glucan family phosphorylase n=1 Tax=Vreelandella halophila TaxID=86177 RepID=A0A9X5B765_9GAMM|nr:MULTISPECIES: alpha-glucan family phosphorylase [Halomonas]MYL27837.1 alpha-glucan family phosphorylase [Halomonas utahensis]MYL74963.1 alpha-glucan family phosphorylase [Halomonas sp. 22501_18_FS]
MSGNEYYLEVRPRLPDVFSRLEELANNLFYSWDRGVRGLFFRIDPELWASCGHNPKVFLRRVAQHRLEALAQDTDFNLRYQEVLAAFDAYLDPSITSPREREVQGLDTDRDLIAYFCMEYGLHESLPLYSGGLGILAGDHCKAASDLGLSFVAVGLMYRQGYFCQTINRTGGQEIHLNPYSLDELPVTLVLDEQGEPIHIPVVFPGREVVVQIWQVTVGRVHLYLLDSDVAVNEPEDRPITYQLYGGDRRMRIAQELLLGVGGVLALRRLGLTPSVWHINEGHSAFLILERCREWVAQGLDFQAALEATAAATVFTTHTAVPAGHDLFDQDLASEYLWGLAEAMAVPVKTLLDLARSPQNRGRFNMTALALRGARRFNGVSRVHRDVAAQMESHVWPDIEPAENPLSSVSNGVHIPTFLAREWVNLFDGHCPDWKAHLDDTEFWQRTIQRIPDHRFWSLTQSLKSDMLSDLGERLGEQYRRNNFSRARIEGMRRVITAENTQPLIIGFARRFATYKRALLIFEDMQRLTRILGDPERPVILLFAGKAHPQDMPGQALIRRVHEFASQPSFLNRVFLIEGYDIALARKLVTGVDVWLNTPEYPLEASGTSGQKAAINGGLNLSILDGWWAEGFDGHNGWGIAPHSDDLPSDQRDLVEAQDLLDMLEHEVVPSYFDVGPGGYSRDWVSRCKASMYTVLPRFSAERMVLRYAEDIYAPAVAGARGLSESGGAGARELAEWKARVCAAWSGVTMAWAEQPPEATEGDNDAILTVDANLNGLSPDDVVVECLLTPDMATDAAERVYRFSARDEDASRGHRFVLAIPAPENGLFRMHVRMYPFNRRLQHPLEMGCMRWV